MNKRIALVLGTLGFFVIALAGSFAVQGYELVKKHLFTSTYHVMNSRPMSINLQDAPMLGIKTAATTIVEFGDFKCPTCMAWERQVFARLEKNYIQSGKVKFYFKPYLVIYKSTDAAIAGLSVYHQDPTAFWQYYEAIYTHQQAENLNWATPKFLKAFVQQYVPTVSAQTVFSDIQHQRDLSIISTSKFEGNQDGVSSTPTVFVDGYRLQNPFDYAAIVKLIARNQAAGGHSNT